MSQQLQSNTQLGRVVYPASVDLSSVAAAPGNGRLLKVVSTGGKANFAALTNKTDIPTYIGDDCGSAIATAPAAALPLDPTRQMRCYLKGACAPGDKLVPADPTTAADAGKVIKAAGSYGTVTIVGLAEETGIDGQLVLFRPMGSPSTQFAF